MRCTLQSLWIKTQNVLIPDWSLPLPFSMRIKVHHGHGGNWQQRHTCHTNEEQNGRRDIKSVPRSLQQNQTDRNHPTMPHTWQQMIRNYETLMQNHCGIELVPPRWHHHNVAEVNIKAFKQYFLSIISGVATEFPMYQWEQLLPQTKLNLNILR